MRELNVFCQVVRHDITAERVRELKPKGIILSGGPASVYEPNAPKLDPGIFDLGIPILGICYGMHLACQALGGAVTPAASREFGRAVCRIHEAASLFEGVSPDLDRHAANMIARVSGRDTQAADCRIIAQPTGIQIVSRQGLGRTEVKPTAGSETGWTDAWLPDKAPPAR